MITPALITDAAQSTSENPFAQLALLPVHQVREHFTCSYVVIGSISVFVWDVLSHLRDDYHILTKHRFTLPTFVYILSRLSTLLYLIGYTIIQTTPLGHCNIAIRLATSLLTIALPATQLLLFLHVRAIYATERVIVWFFTLLWLSTFVSTVIAVVSISGINIGSTDYCTPATLARVNIATIVTPLVNDTLLFVALVVRIMGTSTQDADTCQLKDKFRTALFGTSIPRLAKTLLQNGQQYFLQVPILSFRWSGN
ncbi:hypothetical protein D9619_009371 [Psilocybe cf. subviscida]|uniref:Transmembrane protein n=1 Tax=Psilocybe cf. subviscida TaxID=2480587 RepID=A0A8H5BUF9_9AGAR|nr:hypothetical protein D9619_009371 [Psilocybe cf. subviscida]